MPRGTQLGELVTMFREEAGYANNPSLSQNVTASIEAKLRRTYRRLHADFNWPHLRVQRDKVMQAGERYYSFPSDLAFDRVTDVWVRENGTDCWYSMCYGIDRANYNSIPSDQDEREDFPSYWELFESEQFEVWPIPVTSGHTLRFFGTTRPRALVNQNDIVDLDDDLIVLYAVAEDLARSKSADAELKLQQAQRHYNRLKGNSQLGAPFSMSVSRDRRSPWPGISIDHAEYRDRDA